MVVVLDELVLFLLCNRIAIVSSKTKESGKVFTLHLSRDALLKKTLSKNSKPTWKVLSLSLSLSLSNFCLLATLFAVLSKVNQISTSGLQTAGGVRDPSEEEMTLSPHKSFTQVVTWRFRITF